jgi:hypothetical protein
VRQLHQARFSLRSPRGRSSRSPARTSAPRTTKRKLAQNESPKGQRLPRTVHTTKRMKHTPLLSRQKNRRPMKKTQAGSKNPPLSKLKRTKLVENRNRFLFFKLKEQINRKKEKKNSQALQSASGS